MPSSRGSSNSEIEPRSPTLQADSLPSESQGKPKNTGVGSLSLLQEIFSRNEVTHAGQEFITNPDLPPWVSTLKLVATP